jgi:hypothetical protein
MFHDEISVLEQLEAGDQNTGDEAVDEDGITRSEKGEGRVVQGSTALK